jgi:hypothetical protein
MFVGMSRDSGCSLTHPNPNEADTSDFISSRQIDKLKETELNHPSSKTQIPLNPSYYVISEILNPE